MRYYSFFVGLLIATYCLFFPYQANATPNTYTYSTIDFDDSTGTILATGHTQADYQTGAYYQYTGAGLAIKDADGNMLTNQQSQVRGLTVDVSAQTDAYADQEYTVQTGHYILVLCNASYLNCLQLELEDHKARKILAVAELFGYSRSISGNLLH